MLSRSVRAISRSSAAVARPAVRPFASAAADDLAQRYPKAKVTTLSNGVRVVTEPSSGPQVTVGAYIDSGSRHELDARTAGVANLATRIASSVQGPKIEASGGSLSSWTSREATTFRARVGVKDVAKAVAALGEAVKPQNVSSEALDVERAEALSDMMSVDERADEVVFDRIHETAFRGTPLARSALGTVATVKALTAKDINDYVNTHFTGSRIVVAASGAVDHNAVVEAATAAFGSLPSKSPNAFLVPALYTGSEIRIRDDYLPKAHGIVAFPTAGASDAQQIPLLVAQQLVGSWTKNQWIGTNSSSETVKEIAREHLAEEFKTFNIAYSDTGLFGVYFKVDWQGQTALLNEVLRGITQLSYEVDATHLYEAKQAAKLHMLGKYDNQDKNADEMGRQVLAFGRRIHPAEYVARIDAVTGSAVQDVAQKLFLDRDQAFAAYGPIYEMPDYNWIRARTYWRRL